MNKFEARDKLYTFLKRQNITFQEDTDNGIFRITILYKGYDNCPDELLESCIFFFEKEMEVRVYYDKTASSWCKNSDHIANMMRLLNFINAQVWPRSMEHRNYGLYKSRYLYTPRFFMTEDGYYDITLAFIVAYDFYAISALETEKYITTYCPEALNKLAPAIFGALLGCLDAEQAIEFVKKDVLNDKKDKVFN